jgi:molybdate transport system permease protein
MLQRIKEYLLSLERKNILALFLVILFLLSVIGATSYTRFQWDDKKYADISKTSELVKQLLSEHPDAKYTVEEAEFYQEMYPFYRSYKHLWEPTKGERWLVLWWTEETAKKYHRPEVVAVIWPYNNDVIYEKAFTGTEGSFKFKEPIWSFADGILKNLHIIFPFLILFMGLLLFDSTRKHLIGVLRTLKDSKFEVLMFFMALLLAAFILSVLVSITLHTNEDAFFDSLLTEEVQFAVRLSILTSLISTLVIFVVALPTAYVLARYDFYGRSLIDTLVDMPLALPTIVGGMGLLMLFNTTSFGIYLAENEIKIAFTPLGIVAAQFFVNVPFMVRPFRSTFMSISPRYEYIARTLGCSRAGAFFKVVLPMSFAGLMGGVAITWARCIGEFGAVMMVAGATRLRTEVLPISIFLNMATGSLELAVSAAVIMIIISATMLFIFEKVGKRGAFL